MATTLCLLLAGCAAEGPTVSPNGRSDGRSVSRSGEAWWPAPVAMRVYPSTRFVREGDRVLLEARIELLDALGDPVKWPGRARLELLAATSTSPIRTGGRLYNWSVDLLSLEQQSRHYDPVTRTYLFRLIVDDAAVAERTTVLSAGFSPPTGERVTDQMAISPPGSDR